MLLISVILPTYNPDANRLQQTLSALQQQTLSLAYWELIVVDNNSNPPIKADVSWHSNALIVSEPVQGLSHARVKGFNEAKGDIIVMVDDDNLLSKDYLQQVTTLFSQEPNLGAIGGKSIPLFEADAPAWLNEFYPNLALRDLGETPILQSWDHQYPSAAPIGAGMAILKTALAGYLAKFKSGIKAITDRNGYSLSSGGDNDIVLEVLKSGWQVGYFPQLCLKHIIPSNRMQPKYLARLLHDTNCSWVQLLQQHGINPWKKINPLTMPLRQLKAFFAYQAWADKVNYIKWKGACGLFKGQSQL